jgi:four helix bundle protein
VRGPEINERAFRFACRVVSLAGSLKRAGGLSWAVAPQLLRAGTSIGANLEEATAGQTKPDFIAKVSIALKEAPETHYWLRIVHSCGLLPGVSVEDDLRECTELVAILTATLRSARQSPSRG